MMTSIGEDVEKLESSESVSGIVKWCKHLGKLLGSSSKDRQQFHSYEYTQGKHKDVFTQKLVK